MKRIQRNILIGAALVPAFGFASALPAHAEVGVGQSVKASDYSCGSTEAVTGDTVLYGPVPTQQRSLIYRNCGSGTVNVKADVKYDSDGPCTSVAPGEARVLQALQVLPSRDAYRDAKSC